MPALRSLLLLVASVCVAACPRGASSRKAPEPCRQLGQQCEFEPGKLGACSYRADCAGKDCLYCQSQH